MKPFTPLLFLLLFGSVLSGQNASDPLHPKFFLGVSYGTSFSVLDFADTDINNPNAGFAKNGNKIDLYGGTFLGKRVTLSGTLRYQSFATEIEDLIDTFNLTYPNSDFSGSTENWQTYYLLAGIAYRVSIGKRINFFPRFGFGPLVAQNPGISLSSPNIPITNSYNRTSERGLGFGAEFGIGLHTELGKHFSLLPTFTFSGGYVNIKDVVTTNDNTSATSDYQTNIQSFTLGLSLAYRFY